MVMIKYILLQIAAYEAAAYAVALFGGVGFLLCGCFAAVSSRGRAELFVRRFDGSRNFFLVDAA